MLSPNVDLKEVGKFKNEATEWWIKAKPLLQMNAVRVPYICDNLKTSLKCDSLHDVTIADVGCGGGFLSEDLARTGAMVTGIDPGFEMIAVAKAHQMLDDTISNNLTYDNCSVDELLTQGRQYDAVVASEVVEHAADLKDFLKKVAAIVKPGGSLFVTTVNRTTLSYWLAIVMAEYVLHVVARGTHSWDKFVTPTELADELQKYDFKLESLQGTLYNPLLAQWSCIASTQVTYMAHFLKPAE